METIKTFLFGKPRIKETSIADLKTVSKAIEDKKPVIELFRTENCPTLEQLIVGTSKASLVFKEDGLRDKHLEELGRPLRSSESSAKAIKKDKLMAKKIGMIGQSSAEATIHDIDEKKSKFITDRGIKKELVIKVTLDAIETQNDRDSFYTESLASFLVAKDDVINFTSVQGSFICNGRGYMIMEKFDGNLEDFKKIMKRDASEKDWENMYLQILASLHYLQTKYKMVHHDLHGGNIMIQKTKADGHFKYNIDGKEYKIKNRGFIVKIIDFGYATYIFRRKRYFRHDATIPEGPKWGNYGTSFDKAYDVLHSSLIISTLKLKLNGKSKGSIFKKITSNILKSGNYNPKLGRIVKSKEWTYTSKGRPYGKLPQNVTPNFMIKKLYTPEGSWKSNKPWVSTEKEKLVLTPKFGKTPEPISPPQTQLLPTQLTPAPKEKRKRARKSDCGGLTIVKLKKLATKEKLKGRSKMNKEELCLKLGLEF